MIFLCKNVKSSVIWSCFCCIPIHSKAHTPLISPLQTGQMKRNSSCSCASVSLFVLTCNSKHLRQKMAWLQGINKMAMFSDIHAVHLVSSESFLSYGGEGDEFSSTPWLLRIVSFFPALDIRDKASFFFLTSVSLGSCLSGCSLARSADREIGRASWR